MAVEEKFMGTPPKRPEGPPALYPSLPGAYLFGGPDGLEAALDQAAALPPYQRGLEVLRDPEFTAGMLAQQCLADAKDQRARNGLQIFLALFPPGKKLKKQAAADIQWAFDLHGGENERQSVRKLLARIPTK